MSRFARRTAVSLLSGLLLAVLAMPLAGQDTYQSPPPALAALVDAPVTPTVSVSPDHSWLLLMERPSVPSIAEVAAPELRLAGLRANPATNGPSRARPSEAFRLLDLDGDERTVTGLPANAKLRNAAWSPNGERIAFTHDSDTGIELWTLDVQSGVASRLTDLHLNDAYYGAPFEWVSDSETLIVRAIPAGRRGPPATPMVPTGPVVQETESGASPARTYQDLLKNAHDEDLFEYYATSQLVEVTLNGETAALGAPGIFRDATPSPDGSHVLVQRTERPFSYLVPAFRFPTKIEVWDRQGNTVAEIADLPLAEGVPTAFGSVPEGVRSVEWRPDRDAELFWVEALDGGNALTEAAERDRIFTLAAPFQAQPTAIATLPLRYAGMAWSEDGFALVNESWWATRSHRMYLVDPDDPEATRTLFDRSYEDRYSDPGAPLTEPSERGTQLLKTADRGGTVYMRGQGASPEGNRPFLRQMDLGTGVTQELFRSAEPYYEYPVALVGDDEIITRRESINEPPNYFLRELGGDDVEPITNFPHPYPQLAEIQKEVLSYERADGVPLTATLYLPPGYSVENDGPLPGVVWAYPREFKSADAAGQRTDSPYQFKRVSYWGAVPWVTRGYAIIDNASMPVVGEGDTEPNDSFREQLVANAKAAIDEGVRRGFLDADRVAIGGHSYGAFMTANLLAHSDLFRAGVARSGAYNRTLTPFGFQSEQRLFWESPETYYSMSPFMHADKVNEPILLIHGEADNNSGTFPIQSMRFFNALKGLGATARLVMLPAESHGYAARESILHMLWETDRWLETHVKQAVPDRVSAVGSSGNP